MSSSEKLVYCYNKGCGKKFDPDENTEVSCVYHPGPPCFHDAYKIWKCCGKKSTDFSTWLEIKGCSKGKHSNEKAVEDDVPKIISSKEIRTEDPEKIIVWSGLNKPADRSVTKVRTFVSLPVEVGPNAQRVLSKHAERNSSSKFDSAGGSGVKIGDNCKNNACKATFDGTMTDKQNCLFHPGNAIFHEGIKYWDCCQKKTTDFTSFLDQTGCTKGGHCWTKPKVVDEKVREDWFQAYGLVHINIYCKGALPDQCTFQTDGLNLQVHIIYGYGEKESNLKYALFGEVMPEKCNAIVNERKVEIILKQAGTESWPMLVYDGASADVANDSDEDVYVLGE